jgi:macrolide transport system ATP-binding/permease protein
MDTLLRDLRYAARVLLRSRVVSGLAVLSLALGIGANTTIFTIVNALFLKALPVRDADSLVAVYTIDKKNPGMSAVSHLNWKDLREQSGGVFESLTAYDWVPLSVSAGSGEATLSFGQMVSGEYFETLGIVPAAGRLFTAQDDVTPGGHPVVVLSHAFWSRRFAGRPGAVGEKIIVNATPFEIIGVAPPGFTGATIGVQPDLWAPMAMNRQLRANNNWYEERRGLFLSPLARLKAGTDVATAQAAVTTIAQRLEKEYPDDNEGRSFKLVTFAESTIFPGLRDAAMAGTGMLMVIVGLVLLIACANVANLLLARATTRRREIAVRLALGAGRWTLIRQLLTESLLLAFTGAALGLLLAHWASRAVLGFLPQLPFPVTLSLDLGLDPLVLVFTAAVALSTGIISGLAPAWQMAKPELVAALKERGAAEMRGHRAFNARNLLVGAQVALSLVALVGAGLFVRSLAAAQETDPGFDTEHLGLVSFDISLQGYDEERGIVFLRSIRERIEAVPGVEAVALAKAGPLAGTMMRSVFPEGQEGERGVLVQVNGVTDGYFDALGIPVLRGRAFDETDRKGSAPVVIVNETMAAKFWPDEEALGKGFRFFGEDDLVEVVGVARDAKYNTLGEDPQSYIYRPLEQDYAGAVTLVASTGGQPASLLLPIQRELRELNREMPLVGISTVGQVLHNSLWASRLGASLLALFGALALILATVGIYGVMSYAVSQRSQEIGLRMTLGADRRDVMRMVFRQGMLVVVGGLVLGLGAAAALTRLVGSLLFVSPTDPLVYVAMSFALAAVGALANFFPALRATAVDPLVALRTE